MPDIRYVLRHVVIVALLAGMATSNLSPVLWRGAGAGYRALGLRQFWSMFAPNPAHEARFVDAWAVEGDTRRSLDLSREPPVEGLFLAWGYDRIHKFHKQVALHPDRYAATYAAALCRLHDLHDRVVLVDIRRKPPRPAAARAGERTARTETELGTFPCP